MAFSALNKHSEQLNANECSGRIRARAHLDTVLKVSGKRFLTGQNNQRNQCQQMEPKKKLLPSLGDIEREVVAESREWGRQRLQQRLQQLADQNSEVFPPPATKTSKTHAAKRVGRRKTGR
jgi:hypothetical protein